MIPINALNQLPPETLEYTFIKPKVQPNPLSFDLLQINLDTDLASKQTKTFKKSIYAKTLNNKLRKPTYLVLLLIIAVLLQLKPKFVFLNKLYFYLTCVIIELTKETPF
jgi:hypothetical protein